MLHDCKGTKKTSFSLHFTHLFVSLQRKMLFYEDI